MAVIPDPEITLQAVNDAYWTPVHETQRAAFDEVARTDYRVLRESYDWNRLFSGLESGTHGDRIRVLDAACGPAHFTASVFEQLPPLPKPSERVQVDLLDISPYSLKNAAKVYSRRWTPARQIRARLQDFIADSTRAYDLILSVHGLYTLSPTDFTRTLLNLLLSLRPGGTLLLVQAMASSHYIAWDRALLSDGFFSRARAPYLASDDIQTVLDQLSLQPEAVIPCRARRTIRYEEHRVLDDFLRWCAFDDSISSRDILTSDGSQKLPHSHAYLQSCRQNHVSGSLDLCWQLDADMMVFQRPRISNAALFRLARQVVSTSKQDPWVPLSGSSYASAQEHFEDSSDQRRQIATSVSSLLHSAGVVPTDDSAFSVVSLGCGDGTLDARILASLGAASIQDRPNASRRPETRYTGIELCPVQCAGFQRDHFARLPAPVMVELRNEDVGQIDWTSIDRPHVIWAMHSHYYFDDARAALRHSVDTLRPEGHLVIACAPKGDLNQLASLTWRSHDQSVPFTPQVETWLEEFGLPFSVVRVDAGLRVPEPPLDERLLRFIYQVDLDHSSPYVRTLLGHLVLAIRDEHQRVAHPVDLIWLKRERLA